MAPFSFGLNAELPGVVAARWHDLNLGQVFAVCSPMMRAVLSDEEIIQRLHLILPSHDTVGDVVDLYGLDYAELDALYYGDSK